jgi:NAD(P)-dependent dehydrogenase (short-subunit alcohol dehydrogenase family)
MGPPVGSGSLRSKSGPGADSAHISSLAGCQSSVDAAIEQAGGIDVLISNGSVIFVTAVGDSPIAEMERLFAENTLGAICVTQAVRVITQALP